MTKIALGTWAWGAGAFGGDKVFGSKTDVENLKPVFDTAMKEGLNLWDTATVIEQKNLVQCPCWRACPKLHDLLFCS